jgi:O-antigen ligase
MLLAIFAIFESLKHWLLYSSVTRTLELAGGMTNYLGRDGILRAIATAGQPIALGYVMVVGIGFYFFLQQSIQQKRIRQFGMVLLAAGLVMPLSRGPWVGAAALLVVFIATGPYALRRLMSLALVTALVLPLVSILPGGERVINLLPFIGTTEKENVDYRERLITNSMTVIQRNPWFGSTTYAETPEMEAMRQGEGIIDIVNSYLAVTLETGWIGLALFVTIFAVTLLGIFRAMRTVSNKESEEYLLGRVLLSTLLAVMVIIFSVSSISIIPIVYWSVAGLGVAYTQMVRNNSN